MAEEGAGREKQQWESFALHGRCANADTGIWATAKSGGAVLGVDGLLG